MRYVVTEIEGYPRAVCSGATQLGLSCMVVDAPFNRRVVAVFRTEDLIGNAYVRRTETEKRAEVRVRAATRCDLLNRLDEIARERAIA